MTIFQKLDGVQIFKDLTFELRPGEIHGLIGQNSAGNTTLMRCSAGIQQPGEGSVTIGSKPVYENPENKRKIVYLASNYDFPTNMRVKI